jgi:hypothetical protein
MSAHPHPKASPWKRTRYWTTLACLACVMGGLGALAAGHPLFGWLLILGGLMLAQRTVLGRRGRRTSRTADTALQGGGHPSRKWRKAA